MNKKDREEQERGKKEARAFLLSLKGRKVYASVNSVSRSGMSRRIEFYAIMTADELGTEQPDIRRIGWYIHKATGRKYDVDKGGLLVGGCGMDMIFHVLSSLNYAAASWELGDNYMEIVRSKDPQARVYDSYLFDADRYGRI